jgi:glucokinase
LTAESVDTPHTAKPAEVLDAVAHAVELLGATPASVGVAIPGEVDESGRCYRLPNVSGFEGLPIASELSRRLGCPVVIENDASTAALGELLYGWGAHHASFLLVTLGTGVGGGIVLDGRMRRGAFGFAAEIGHILVDSSSSAWPCACGQTGCMESYAGTHGLLRRYAELGGSAHEPADVAAAAIAGDERARKAFASMGEALGIGLAQVQKVLDLEAVVFAGGVSQSFDLIEPALRASLREHVFGAPTADVPLLVSALGAHAGIIGAAALPERAATGFRA